MRRLKPRFNIATTNTEMASVDSEAVSLSLEIRCNYETLFS